MWQASTSCGCPGIRSVSSVMPAVSAWSASTTPRLRSGTRPRARNPPTVDACRLGDPTNLHGPSRELPGEPDPIGTGERTRHRMFQTSCSSGYHAWICRWRRPHAAPVVRSKPLRSRRPPRGHPDRPGRRFLGRLARSRELLTTVLDLDLVGAVGVVNGHLALVLREPDRLGVAGWQ